jgi:ABC-type branched-subunit amino acid transport system permease subunit
LRIGAEDKAHLHEMARWARFIAIVGFVMLGIMALVMLSIIGFSNSNPLLRNSDTPAGLMFAVFLLMIVLYFFPINYLFKAAKGIKGGLTTNDDIALSDGFKNLKSHYKFMGIFMVVVLSFYALAIVVGLGAGLSAL